MQSVVPSLKVGDQGAAVGDLQDALRLLVEKDKLVLAADLKKELLQNLSQERAVQRYGDASTLLLVKRLQAQYGLPESGELDATSAKILNNLLGSLDALDTGMCCVCGKIIGPDRALPTGLPVEILDKNIGSDEVVAQTHTDASGHYKVSFGNSAFRMRRKEQPDLQTRVRIGQATFVSEIRYNASADETLDILLPANVAELPSEYESLTAAVTPHWREALSSLQESDTRSDITYLGNKTGWDARAVAMAALADKFSRAQDQNAPISPEMFYALFRAGLPADENTLYHTDASTLSTIWKQATDQGVIPSALAEQIPQMVERFQKLAAQKLLQGPALAGASSFKDMLAVADLNEQQKQQFAEAYVTHRADLPTFWTTVKQTLGQDLADRLQRHGKLAFLTMNNAPLMRQLDAKGTPVQLVRAGYHRPEKWAALLTAGVPIPPEIPGETEAAKRENYAKHLGALLRLSYPTAAVAELVEMRELPVDHHTDVSQFLTDHMEEFEIGTHPIDQYIARNKLDVKPEIVSQVRRVQRVYQITKTDSAMGVLLEKKLDAAYHIAQHERATFVKTFGEQLGGEQNAGQIHDRASQVHTATLNIAVSYLTARNSFPLGKASLDPKSGTNGQVLQPFQNRAALENGGSVIAYPTLEGLFGSMDFCECKECRSILSPAAYLVDLLQFLYSDEKQWDLFVQRWKKEHADAPYPFVDQASWTKFKDDWNAQHPGQQPPNTEISPFAVLMSRRPDIQHLPLTCENTNTALPYIDLVNETLEYFVANSAKQNSLEGYQGHDTGSINSEDLLASPQYVIDATYETLKNAKFPPPLPFNQPLESLRRYFNRFDVLQQVTMEQLCLTDDLERGANSYGWRDILMEELGLSRQEYQLVTDSTVTWKQAFGFDQNKPDSEVLAILSNAKLFARRIGVTYEELVALLKTRFINPNINLIPKLERLGVPFATIQALYEGRISERDFNALLPTGLLAPDPSQYGGNIVNWIKDEKNYGRIKSIITLIDTFGTEGCNFGKFTLGYAIPSLGNSSFEIPTVKTGTFQFTPTGTGVAWTFFSQSGIKANGADQGDISAPVGSQTAFIQHASSIEQVLTFESGAYALSFLVARRVYPPGNVQPIKVGVGATSLGVVTPPSTSFTRREFAFSIPQSGEYAVHFEGTDSTDDKSTLLDAVVITRLLSPLDFIKLLRFIRLWKTLGWTIEQTDAAICAGLDPDSITTVEELGKAFQVLLPRLGLVKRVMRELGLTPGRDLLPLLACWSDIGIHGEHSLYRQMFLNPTILKQDPVFADNGYGEFLTKENIKLIEHSEALRGAFNLSGDEFAYIVQILGFTNETPLTVPNISKIFRAGWLSRKFGLSVQELDLLIIHTGLDPFAMFEIAADAKFPTNAMRFTPFVQALKARSMKPATALNLIWHQDIGGRSAPDEAQIVELARLLRSDFATINAEFTGTDSSEGDTFRKRLALVYGQETADAFYAHLENTLELSVPYTHSASSLESAITSTDPDLTYDRFQHRLVHFGCMTLEEQQALKGVPGVSPEFTKAVEDLFTLCKQVRDSFLQLYPELKPLYDVYAQADASLKASTDYTHPSDDLESSITEADRHLRYDKNQTKLTREGVMSQPIRDALTAVAGVSKEFQAAVSELFIQGQKTLSAFFLLVDAFQGRLAQKRKRAQALQRLAATVGTDLQSTVTLLDPALGPGSWYPLHAATDRDQPVLNDVLAIEMPGLQVDFFYKDTAGGNADQHVDAEVNLDYSDTNGHPLPKNLTVDAAISGFWQGKFDVPETAPYNIIIAADAGAKVTLILDGNNQELASDGTLWRNKDLLELKAGTMHDIFLKVEKVKSVLSVRWESPKQRLQVIPGRHLYPPSVFPPFRNAFVRFLKIVALASHLRLTTSEIAYLATNAEDLVNDDVWLNILPTEQVVRPPQDPKSLQALIEPLWGLLDFARIKAEWSSDDERVLAVLKDPNQATATPDSLLFKLSRWNKASLEDLLGHFSKGIPDLVSLRLFRRAYEAFAPIQRIAIPASKLILTANNEPSIPTVRDFQAALRARFDAASWRDLVRPINDTLRGLQRDALVAYILHQMRENQNTAHIDTADKLFEYFLMDVEMEPCMQTSRIRNALSTVQLFIERCLMNLEPEVSPAVIDAQKWTWMKRYRLWDGNRKVFLFPENWLEPELRDNKSPFFKEIETQLLQSDITDDSAASAMLDYLAKLDEVATLEPCGMYIDEKGTEDVDHVADDVVHVVARTTGAHRIYYYRRYESGSWTPWEQIQLEIEDNPVIPVVRNNRLLLLWLRTIKQLPQALSVPGPGQNADATLANLTFSQLSDAVKKSGADNLKQSVEAVLCWSEYNNGKWQAVRTSDVNRPLHVGDFSQSGIDAFDRSKLLLYLFNIKGGGMFALVSYGKLDRRIGYFTLDRARRARVGDQRDPPDGLLEFSPHHLYAARLVSVPVDEAGVRTLEVEHKSADGNTNDSRRILSSKTSDSLQRVAFDFRSDWWGSFLFADFQYTYWVTVSDKPPTVRAYFDYGSALTPVRSIQGSIATVASRFTQMMGEAPERNREQISFQKVGVAGRPSLTRGGPPEGDMDTTISYGSKRIGLRGAISLR